MSDLSTEASGIATGVALASGTMSRLLGRAAGQGRSVTAWRVLTTLDRLGPQRVGDLAIEQRVAQPTMTGLVIRMENDQLVQRQPDPGDGRASLVSLTGDGKEAIEAYRQRAISSLAGGIDSFSAEERRILAQAVPLLHGLNALVAATRDHSPQKA
ncbi:MAG: MarR family transcriptional regulator [Glutamicibacter sp.]|uniref:MarR family winged helix-turn-helix transcriptional regulator n=1 Tax=Glutamicibacter sp. TaxID=1931995 RepID=UPI002FC7E5E4